MLPKTIREIPNGGIYLQQIRCGKPNCKCSRGETHPAHYFLTRRGGKLIKIYIRQSELEGFSELVAQAKAERRERLQIDRYTVSLFRQVRETLRDNNELLRTLKARPKQLK